MDEIERERWRGSVDAELRAFKSQVVELFRLSKECERDRQRLELLINTLTGSVNTLAMKIGLISGVGAILGSAAMQYVLSLLKSH